ncbi:hypothetical protein N0V94_007500 [Neodidymelliopsis sp. IMI 364377]|nr:hypothetical protein N0V94_007500 [Neodidymelliopsis sp. IMI 364377]
MQNKHHYTQDIRELAPQVDQMQFVGLDKTDVGIADTQSKKLVIGRLANSNRKAKAVPLYAHLITTTVNAKTCYNVHFYAAKDGRSTSPQKMTQKSASQQLLDWPFNRARYKKNELTLWCRYYFLVMGLQSSGGLGARSAFKLLEAFRHSYCPSSPSVRSLDTASESEDSDINDDNESPIERSKWLDLMGQASITSIESNVGKSASEASRVPEDNRTRLTDCYHPVEPRPADVLVESHEHTADHAHSPPADTSVASIDFSRLHSALEAKATGRSALKLKDHERVDTADRPSQKTIPRKRMPPNKALTPVRPTHVLVETPRPLIERGVKRRAEDSKLDAVRAYAEKRRKEAKMIAVQLKRAIEDEKNLEKLAAERNVAQLGLEESGKIIASLQRKVDHFRIELVKTVAEMEKEKANLEKLSRKLEQREKAIAEYPVSLDDWDLVSTQSELP